MKFDCCGFDFDDRSFGIGCPFFERQHCLNCVVSRVVSAIAVPENGTTGIEQSPAPLTVVGLVDAKRCGLEVTDVGAHGLLLESINRCSCVTRIGCRFGTDCKTGAVVRDESPVPLTGSGGSSVRGSGVVSACSGVGR